VHQSIILNMNGEDYRLHNKIKKWTVYFFSTSISLWGFAWLIQRKPLLLLRGLYNFKFRTETLLLGYNEKFTLETYVLKMLYPEFNSALILQSLYAGLLRWLISP